VQQLRASPERLLAVGVVLFAPLLGVLLLRSPLMNNLAYRDPWFYSGYGWTPAHHVEIFGWFPYYGVRFPVTLPIAWSTAVLGPVAGYLALRYLILTATGGMLYACVRQFATAWVAAASVVLLALNPFYVRMVLWDYTSYVAFPAAIAGVALWLLSSTRGRVFWPFLIAGALYSAAVFANPLSATFGAPLIVIELIAALRRDWPELARFFLRCVAAVIGVVLAFAGGYLGYMAYLGGYSPIELVEPTLEFSRQNQQLSSPFQHPLSEFLDGEPRIYAPVLLSLATVVLLGRRLAENTLRGRMAQYAVGFLALMWLYRFSVTSAIIETWWAYNMAAVSMCFAVPVILDQLDRKEVGRGTGLVLAGALGGAAIPTVLIRNFNSTAVDAYEAIRDNSLLIVILLGAGVAGIVVARIARSRTTRAAGVAAFFAVVAVVGLTPARIIGINQTGEFADHGRTELWGYQAAYDMSKLLEETDQPNSRTLLWTTLSGFPVIAWTNLPHQGSSIQTPDAPLPSLDSLSPQAIALAKHPTTDDVLLLSGNPADVPDGVSVLRREGLRPRLRRRGTWANGYLYYALVDVTPQ
jgi:hypothetical protein